MFFSLDHLIVWLLHYKYAVLFPAAIIEGPIITILAGFFAAHGYLQGTLALAVLMVGDLVGDSLYYAVGRWGKQLSTQSWTKYVGLTPERLTLVKQHYVTHSGKTLLIGKLTHGIGSVFLMGAGAAEMPFGKFLWFNTVGTIPKSCVLFLLGYYFGQAYLRFNRYIDYTGLGVIILSLLGLLVYTVVAKRRLKKAAHLKEPLL